MTVASTATSRFRSSSGAGLMSSSFDPGNTTGIVNNNRTIDVSLTHESANLGDELAYNIALDKKYQGEFGSTKHH